MEYCITTSCSHYLFGRFYSVLLRFGFKDISKIIKSLQPSPSAANLHVQKVGSVYLTKSLLIFTVVIYNSCIIPSIIHQGTYLPSNSVRRLVVWLCYTLHCIELQWNNLQLYVWIAMWLWATCGKERLAFTCDRSQSKSSIDLNEGQ